MSGFSHILVPTDGSEGALQAAKVAGDLARALAAKVTVVYVQEEDSVLSHAWGAANFPVGAADGLKSIEQVRASLEQRAQENELPAAVKALGELSQVPESVVIWDHPSEGICRYARDNKVDLIVIGSHGRSGLKRAFLGSVSQAVANQAPCPVTIVR
ncbi:MAG: universal stress protein [Pseudohongiellaceae bacterium]